MVLVASPFLFYLYQFAPKNSKVWKIGFLTIYSGGFESVLSFLHAFFTKFLFVLLTSIWFLTCSHWWKYAILIPFSMFLFQLSGVLNYQIQFIDQYDFWYSLPLVLPIVIGLIWWSARLYIHSKLLDLRSQIENELEIIRRNKNVDEV